MGRGCRLWMSLVAALTCTAPAFSADAAPPATSVARSTRDPARSGGASAKAERPTSDLPKQAKSPAANPFEPFLKQWIDPRNRTAVAVAEGSAGAVSLTLPSQGSQSQSALKDDGKVSLGAPGSPNPYLAAPTPPPSQKQSPAAPAAAGSDTASNTAAATLTAPESPVSTSSSGYRPPASKDAKYFPQQKRF